MLSNKKYSDRLNLAQSINWVKKQESLAEPACLTCGLKDAIGFEFKPDGKTVNTICARGHKSTWRMTPKLWKCMYKVHKLIKKNGYLKY